MELSRVVEWLMTIRRPGGPMLTVENAQLHIPMFPPNTTLSFSAGPVGSDFAQIVFQCNLGPQTVPGVFSGTITMGGQKVFTGVFYASAFVGTVSGFQWVTWAQPTTLVFTNISGLYQEVQYNYTYIRIPSENDYNTILDWIEHISTSHVLEDLNKQILNTLKGTQSKNMMGR